MFFVFFLYLECGWKFVWLSGDKHWFWNMRTSWFVLIACRVLFISLLKNIVKKMPMLFCYYGKIETGGYFIGTIQLLFGTFFMIESIYEVYGAEPEVIQFMSFSKFWNLIFKNVFNIIFLFIFSFALRYNYFNCTTNFSSLWNIQAKLKIYFCLVSIRCVRHHNWFVGQFNKWFFDFDFYNTDWYLLLVLYFYVV